MRSAQNIYTPLDLIANRLDEERLYKFVHIAIEASHHHLELLGHTMTQSERFEYEQVLNQGVFLSLALSNLRR